MPKSLNEIIDFSLPLTEGGDILKHWFSIRDQTDHMQKGATLKLRRDLLSFPEGISILSDICNSYLKVFIDLSDSKDFETDYNNALKSNVWAVCIGEVTDSSIIEKFDKGSIRPHIISKSSKSQDFKVLEGIYINGTYPSYLPGLLNDDSIVIVEKGYPYELKGDHYLVCNEGIID